jgi:mRNA interferase RelE/StbE
MKDVRFSKPALKQLLKLQPQDAKRIRAKIDAFASGDSADVARMVGSPFHRIRVGQWRVIVDDDGLVVLVVKVGHRREVY